MTAMIEMMPAANWLTSIGLGHYLTVSFTLFAIGLLGVIGSRHIIRVLMSVELMLNAVNIALVAFNNAVQPNELSGQVFSIFVLTISAAEAAVGLALVIALYRAKATVDMNAFTTLRG
ncbi:MAG: NADH-quinone oxidoreductase subunit NuoK [Vampirovibrionales bacterium]|nr:NADH-quinone oxidoreductase subunit NuoK [Vampirovibrionales bacterium]